MFFSKAFSQGSTHSFMLRSRFNEDVFEICCLVPLALALECFVNALEMFFTL